MARGLNKVMLIGNLGADPEVKYSASGTPIASFNMATSDNRKNKDGEWEDRTEWHKIVMFGRQAEICKDYLKKGSKIFLDGRLQTRSWDDQSGQKRYLTEVVGNNMVMLDSKSQASSMNESEHDTSYSNSEDMPESPPNNLPKADDDLPF
ncbi:MAG: single-stranded DNA-binding protein [Candidatus Latescibacteria bacterium]|nr:single-stranded DNA-binding protein [Candidatus Latescibacterota bacterium]